MAIESSQLLARLRSLAPFEDDDAARRVRDATLMALRRGLTDDDADWLALDLGPELAAPLVRGVYVGDLSLEPFYRWVARFTGLRRSVAREQAQVVCRVLAELLSPSTVARLQRRLPELAVLLAQPEPEQPASEPHRLRADPAPVTPWPAASRAQSVHSARRDRASLNRRQMRRAATPIRLPSPTTRTATPSYRALAGSAKSATAVRWPLGGAAPEGVETRLDTSHRTSASACGDAHSSMMPYVAPSAA
jgi:uncharacterized protein (DUF2267 family)